MLADALDTVNAPTASETVHLALAMTDEALGNLNSAIDLYEQVPGHQSGVDRRSEQSRGTNCRPSGGPF